MGTSLLSQRVNFVQINILRGKDGSDLRPVSMDDSSLVTFCLFLLMALRQHLALEQHFLTASATWTHVNGNVQSLWHWQDY